jgi:DNA topoisomerase-1
MYKLIICESPSKCPKIQSFLGPEYKVIASLGHIRALIPKIDSVGLTNNFEPKYEWIALKAKTIMNIKECAKNASIVYLSSDFDREGEMISYSICQLLNLNPATTPRLVYTEITEKALKHAIQNPQHLNMNHVNAQQARALLDLMIGFTISPLLWKSVGPSLSAGRCIIPALRLVADRENTIKNFSSTLSWVISGSFSAVAGAKATKKTQTFEASMDDELDDEESAQNYLSNHIDATKATVLTNALKPTSSQPPKPLITSTLQQQASTLYRAGPAQTMKAAQRLYEGGHITYMRTDHAVLSEDAVKEAKEYIIENWGEEYFLDRQSVGAGTCADAEPSAGTDPKKKTKKTTKKKEEGGADAGSKAQEAHEAIRPTHIHQVILPGTDWSSLERNLYNLIWLRTVQSVMAPARGEQCTVRFAFEDEADDWIWRSNFSRTTFPGWKATITKETTVQEEDDEADALHQQKDCSPETWAYATQTLKPSTPLTYTKLTAAAHVTKPVSRYNEAGLIKDMEAKGIGRPSTYASLMETIQEKLYVEKRDTPARTVTHNSYSVNPGHAVAVALEERKVGGEKDRLYPTALGLSVLEYCVQHFGDLFDYGFTAQMENRLDAIAAGSEPWKQVLKDTWASYKDRYEELNKETGSAKRREFAGGIVAVSTAKGPLLLKEEDQDPPKKGRGKKAAQTSEPPKATFYGWPQGKTLQSITQADVDAFLAQKVNETEETTIGTHNDTPIVRKKGPYGLYCEWGSVRVPYKDDSTLESIIEDLEKKEGSTLRSVGDIVIKNGPYGVYMYKKAVGKSQAKSFKPTFVSVPKEADWKTATEAELAAMYSAGVDQKKAAWKAKKGGSKK